MVSEASLKATCPLIPIPAKADVYTAKLLDHILNMA